MLSDGRRKEVNCTGAELRGSDGLGRDGFRRAQGPPGSASIHSIQLW
jgi:hypothetical protein